MDEDDHVDEEPLQHHEGSTAFHLSSGLFFRLIFWFLTGKPTAFAAWYAKRWEARRGHLLLASSSTLVTTTHSRHIQELVLECTHCINRKGALLDPTQRQVHQKSRRSEVI